MCGIFAAWNVKQASNLTYLGLYALQHRGQESVGIISTDGEEFFARRKMRLVADAFQPSNIAALKGNGAIGHVRYSTTGESAALNMQPFTVTLSGEEIAIAHNGNLVNAKSLKAKLEDEGAIFQSTADTEIILHLISRSRKKDLFERIEDALSKVRGAYSLFIMTNDALYVARDPYGYRPLVVGSLDGGICISSESCAFDLIGADMKGMVEPGELVCYFRSGEEKRAKLEGGKRIAQCVFEHVYFSRPDSVVFGEHVYEVRKAMGRTLAKEHPVNADLVLPVPDSGIPAALGFAEQANTRFDLGLIRNHYVHRTFIEPDQKIRNFGVRVKLNPQNSLLKDRRVVVVDDSIVRGTTSRKIVAMLREAGAKEVHFRVSSPPITGPCYFGINTPTKEELIGSKQSVGEIQAHLGVDSLGYLSHDGMLSVLNQKSENFCTGCFSGDYPEPVEQG